MPDDARPADPEAVPAPATDAAPGAAGPVALPDPERVRLAAARRPSAPGSRLRARRRRAAKLTASARRASRPRRAC